MPAPKQSDFELNWTIAREASLGPGDESALLAEANRRLFRRWMAAGRGEWMVPRDAFDVVELGSVIGSLCVYDRDEAADDYLCRVFGGAVVADLGVDMTGQYMSCYPAELGDAVRRGYDTARTSRWPYISVHLLIRSERDDFYRREDGRVLHEKLVLPVTRSGRGIDCFITHVARLPADALRGVFPIAEAGPNGVA